MTIRANGIGTQWHDEDVRAIATSGADAIVDPEGRTRPRTSTHVDAALEHAGAPDDLDVWAMIETPTAIWQRRARSRPPTTG